MVQELLFQVVFLEYQVVVNTLEVVVAVETIQEVVVEYLEHPFQELVQHHSLVVVMVESEVVLVVLALLLIEVVAVVEDIMVDLVDLVDQV